MFSAMDLFHCAGGLAWPIIILSGVISVQYFLIAYFIFYKAYKCAKTADEKFVWFCVTFIFPFCAMAGYVTNILAGWYPDLAYMLKLSFFSLDVMVCTMFLFAARGRILISESKKDVHHRSEKNGILEAIRNFNNVDSGGDVDKIDS